MERDRADRVDSCDAVRNSFVGRFFLSDERVVSGARRRQCAVIGDALLLACRERGVLCFRGRDRTAALERDRADRVDSCDAARNSCVGRFFLSDERVVSETSRRECAVIRDLRFFGCRECRVERFGGRDRAAALERDRADRIDRRDAVRRLFRQSGGESIVCGACGDERAVIRNSIFLGYGQRRVHRFGLCYLRAGIAVCRAGEGRYARAVCSAFRGPRRCVEQGAPGEVIVYPCSVILERIACEIDRTETRIEYAVSVVLADKRVCVQHARIVNVDFDTGGRTLYPDVMENSVVKHARGAGRRRFECCCVPQSAAAADAPFV